jgi:heme exporter protein C
MKNIFIAFVILTVGLLAFSTYQALFVAPTEQTMGEVQRIFYYHVPSAWTAGVCFFVNFLASVLYLSTRQAATRKMPRLTAPGIVVGLILGALIGFLLRPSAPVLGQIPFSVVISRGSNLAGLDVLLKSLAEQSFNYMIAGALVGGVLLGIVGRMSKGISSISGTASDALAAASAEVGVMFCTIVLITGPIWARPVWGIWWTWDARLTTTLVLWLIYVSYLVLRRFAAGGQTQVLAAALAIFGFVDVPIVYMSIRWFRTQHPSPVMGGGENSGLDPAMLHAFFWNLLAFTCVGIVLMVIRYRLQIAEQNVEAAHAALALQGGAQ